MSNLRAGGITEPDKMVLRELGLRYAANIDAVADSVDATVAFYRLVQSLPSTSTRLLVENSLQLHIKGPSLSSPNIFTASDESSRKFVIKILRGTMSGGAQYLIQSCEIFRECQAPIELGLSNPPVALVQTEVLTITDSFSSKVYKVLKMPRYLCTLAEEPKSWPRELLEQGARMREALSYMHDREVVHMDIKASNIFIAADGHWVLGDFGSSERIGEVITSSNLQAFSKTPVVGQAADTKYDWFMLLLVLLREYLQYQTGTHGSKLSVITEINSMLNELRTL